MLISCPANLTTRLRATSFPMGLPSSPTAAGVGPRRAPHDTDGYGAANPTRLSALYRAVNFGAEEAHRDRLSV